MVDNVMYTAWILTVAFGCVGILTTHSDRWQTVCKVGAALGGVTMLVAFLITVWR